MAEILRVYLVEFFEIMLMDKPSTLIENRDFFEKILDTN
jgi:hypothetical protein